MAYFDAVAQLLDDVGLLAHGTRLAGALVRSLVVSRRYIGTEVYNANFDVVKRAGPVATATYRLARVLRRLLGWSGEGERRLQAARTVSDRQRVSDLRLGPFGTRQPESTLVQLAVMREDERVVVRLPHGGRCPPSDPAAVKYLAGARARARARGEGRSRMKTLAAAVREVD